MNPRNDDERPSMFRSSIYEIVIDTILDQKWENHFQGMNLVSDENSGTTTITGEVVDQTALHRHLQTIYDLNLPILSVSFSGPA